MADHRARRRDIDAGRGAGQDRRSHRHEFALRRYHGKGLDRPLVTEEEVNRSLIAIHVGPRNRETLEEQGEMAMQQEQTVAGGIIVHSRTELYKFGARRRRYCIYADATDTGDIDGAAAEAFVMVDHADGSQTHNGFGTFTGNVKGRSGALVWKIKGKPGSGEIEVVSGTDELSDLKGLVTYVINEGSKTEFTYSGVLK
jgi:hypothetical protein